MGTRLMLVMLLVCGVLSSGCEVKLALAKAPEVINSVTGAVEQADPVVDALEDVVGPVVPAGVAETGENVAGKVGVGLQVGASLLNIIPGGQAYAGLLASLGVLATGLSGFLGRRLAKSQAALKTMVKVADTIGSPQLAPIKTGKAIKEFAATEGTSVEIEKAYLAVKKES